MTAPQRARSTQPPLDRVDRRILDHLADHGRSSLADLAEAVSISPSSAQRRLRRLESEQVVRGYRAVLDPEAVDRGLVVHLSVTLVDHTENTVGRFERHVVDLDGLVSCHHVTGDVDYLLRVDVADVAALDVLLRRTLARIPGVARLTTMVATSALVDRVTHV
ncbi:Lrp/AsnC family transcriptional regulator [Actinomycetospora cinnamomea]|uniref:Lrp/AsnC family transcriptional regulator n=1 Tax=Actinomycetospora cinnamomea TaxID=663609 RepID=UPI000E3103BD|nr:Lrp/AsnC family transcriptional regulator [Actinomycetospora cinnamomea]